MPYVNCEGKTYSRYDTSPYVKECIRKEKVAWKKQQAERKKWIEEHPQEYKDQVFQQRLEMISISGVIVILFALVVWAVGKSLNEW